MDGKVVWRECGFEGLALADGIEGLRVYVLDAGCIWNRHADDPAGCIWMVQAQCGYPIRKWEIVERRAGIADWDDAARDALAWARAYQGDC